MPNINHFKENFELELNSFKSTWWVRYGIMTSFILILIIVILAKVIQYPQQVSGVFKIYSNDKSAVNIPIHLRRKIDKIWVENEEKVKKGQIILSYFDNSRLSDVEYIELLTQNAINDKITLYQLYNQIANKVFKLGTLQSRFTELDNLLLENYLYLEYDEDGIIIKNLKEDLKSYKSLKGESSKLLKMDIEEAKILKEQFVMDSIIFRTKAISKWDFLKKKEEYLVKTKVHQQNILSYERLETEITKLTNSLYQLENKKKENIYKISSRIKIALNQFAGEINNWREDNLLISPLDGKVSFMGHFNEQEINLSDDNSIVVTLRPTSYKVLIDIPFIRAGEVSKGKKVQLMLDDFPYREYGFLEGEISSISNVAGKESYRCDVNFKTPLLTNQGENIVFREKMGGIAHIVTEERSLLAMLFDKITYLFKK